MSLTYDDYVGKMSTILENVNDPATVSELLTDLRGNYADVIQTVEALTAENEKLKTSNASLIEANGKLFLQVGVTQKQDPEPIEDDDDDSPTIEQVLTTILDDKGRF